MIEFTVEGKPQGKARARTFYNKKMGKMQSITPEKTKSYEDLIRWSFLAAGGKYLGDQTLKVEINAYYPIPNNFNKSRRVAALMNNLRPTTKPDCDNIIKVVLDALNGVAYYDDKQVLSVSCNKWYAESGSVTVTITEI